MGMTVQDFMDIQHELQEKYKGVWEGDSPETAKHHLLYAVEEIGEVSAILKKKARRRWRTTTPCAPISARKWRMCLCT